MSELVTQLVRAGAPGATERLFYMYIPAEGMAAMNPQRGAPTDARSRREISDHARSLHAG